MGKYNYKRDVFKGLNPFPFLGEVKTRLKNIEQASSDLPESVFNPNILGQKLHPHCQFAVVDKVIESVDSKSFVLVPDPENGTKELAYFRAGQYVSVAFEIEGKPVTRAYTISSSPKSALGSENTSYTLTVKKTANGYVSDWILNNWNKGSKVLMSGPLGNFYYQELRDARNVIAVAGGSGITPFASMAAAIADGIEDFNLTILYGSRTADSILLKNELDAIANKSDGKVKVINILSDEDKDGFEHGYISSEIISKYADGDYSLFVCGPKALYDFIENEVPVLNIPGRRVRYELSGEFGDPAQEEKFPAEFIGKEFKVKVYIKGDTFDLNCKSQQSLLNAMESAGISVPSDCRSGKCGWCHSRLISGNVFVPEKADGRRAADKKFGWIHPCSSYPLSDIEIEVFPIM